MSVQSADVRAVEFRLARRGYDEQQVDDFLDRVVTALDERDAELGDLRRQVAADPSPESPMDGLAERPHSAVDLLALADRTAQEHVAAASAAAAEVLAAARQEAAAVTAAAEAEADRLRAQAQAQHNDALGTLHGERRRLEETVSELRRLTAQSRSDLEAYLSGLLDVVRDREQTWGPRPLPALSA